MSGQNTPDVTPETEMYSRRQVLAGVGSTGTVGVLAGCLTSENGDEQGVDPDELDGYVRPDTEPETVPQALRCDIDDFERRSGWITENTVEWGVVTGEDGTPRFGLRVDSLSVARGESVTITLTNSSGEEQTTGNPHKANLDVYTEAGWQDPRGWEDGQPKPITDDRWSFAPGESHEWQFKMTEDGVVDGDYHDANDGLVTCPTLPAGRYRFATAAPEQGDIAVAFDLLQ